MVSVDSWCNYCHLGSHRGLRLVTLTPSFVSIDKSPALNIFKRFILFLDRGEGMEKERERNINTKEKH